MNLEKYQALVNEQHEYFTANLQSDFQQSWDAPSWRGGVIGSGWLKSRSGRTYFKFEEIKKLAGLANLFIDKDFQEFMKAVMVLSYRKSNSNASPQKLYAEVLILKRWYSALYTENPKSVHPCFLSTLILNQSFQILFEHSNKTNLPDHAGTYLRLQNILNHYDFTEQKLDFSEKLIYINQKNRTTKAKKTKELTEKLELDEDELDKEKLISIQTFINVVSLISLCQTNGEKIVLNLLLLLIVTGLRSTEAILLKTDALIKKPILDPITKQHLSIDGVLQYTLGIQYHGAKGAGFRTHWVEPFASNLVEMIFASVLELTKEYREHILYIRSKNIRDFLPKLIDDIPEEYVEIDDLIGTVFGVKDGSRAHQRDVVIKTLKNKLAPYKEERNGKHVKKYFLKSDLNNFITSLANYGSEFPLNHTFNYGNNIENIPFENLLFIHEYRSTTLQRNFYNKTNVIPLSVIIINNFLGSESSNNISVFEKYKLLENQNEYSSLSSHIPRHNINTFLALAGIAEHLQAILMGRVDISQNKHYQHLALKQSRLDASIFGKNEIITIESQVNHVSTTPLESIKYDGLMYFSNDLSFENNIKMNLQSFDNKNEISSYIKGSFFDDYFKDIEQSFNDLLQDDPDSANALVKRHAYLYPLAFGGCMRDISIHDCYKRLACQSGERCGNFTLTGRKGEIEIIQINRQKLLNEYHNLKNIIKNDESYLEMLEQLREKIEVLEIIENMAIEKRSKFTPISVFPYSDTISKLPETLSELFAIEHQKIESKEI